MKKFIVLLMAIGLVSCSDDEGSKTRTLFLESLNVTSPGGGGSGAIEFTYNDEKQIKTILGSGVEYTMKYKDGRLSSFSNEDETTSYEFDYDSDGILETLTENGVDHDVTYDEDDRKYTIEDIDRSFTLNEKNDIIEIEQGGETFEFEYDNENKGAMYSLPSEFYLISFLLNSPYLLSVHPATDFMMYSAENTFNADGYIQKAVLTIDGENEPAATVYYNYIQL
jgi:hypothetical protein